MCRPPSVRSRQLADSTHLTAHTFDCSVPHQALEFMSELEEPGIDKHGYAFMTGGRRIGRAAQTAPGTPAPDIASLEKAFVSALEWFEGTALTKYAEGPYLLGEQFSLLDIMVISSMERLAAGGCQAGSTIDSQMRVLVTTCRPGLSHDYSRHQLLILLQLQRITQIC